MGKIIKKIIKKIPVKTVDPAEQFETVMATKKIGVPAKKKSKVNPLELVPTGSTTFNLECSGFIEGAFKTGKMVNLIGDSHAGKTLFAFTIFAECALLERFDDYDFIYDDVEAANEFDLEELFGEECAERIDESIRSKTIEDFNDNVARALDDDRPFIYVLDSFDALTSEAALAKDAENRKKREKGNQTTGDYGDGKPKIFSRFCSMRIQDLSDKGSILIIISQTRDNIGFGAQFTPKTRSGGKALKFYAFHEIWLACQKKTKEGKRTMVTDTQAKITKNKLTGNHGECYFPILRDYGVDNLRSCINFMIDEGDWTGTPGAINTKGFLDPVENSKGKKKHPSIKVIIDDIEEENREDEMFELCQELFDSIMENLKPKRKRKY
jgi:RecA/RadA recombinase